MVIIGVAFILSAIQLLVTRAFAKLIIHITCMITILIHIAIAVIFAISGVIGTYAFFDLRDF